MYRELYVKFKYLLVEKVLIVLKFHGSKNINILNMKF